MKHTRVPRTVRRHILRLAIETSSIPSLHLFEAESEIRSKVESKTVNKPNGPNRKSNRLKQEKFHIPCATQKHCITWADWCGAMFALSTPLTFDCSKNNVACRGIQFVVRCYRTRADQAGLPFTNFVPTSISPTLYGMLYSVVMFLHQRTKDTGTHNPTDQDVDDPKNTRCLWWVASKMKSGRPIKIKIILY